jgi:tRNA dimethylallyltransferase
MHDANRPSIDSESSFASGQEAWATFAPLVGEVIVITGATASGKSAVALELAERLDAEILSLDSIAVYRGMDIGTAKPSPADRARIPHHLLDLVAPDQDFSVACFLKAAHEAIAEIRSRGREAIFVGGTPMFLKGVLRGFDPGPPADWEFREAVEHDVSQHGLQALYDRLRQVDPLAAHRIAPTDKRRMIRALEVARHTGVPLSHRQTQFDQGRSAGECRVFAIHWPREQLHQRINCRVGQMFDAGLVDEVRGLLAKHGSLSRTAAQAVGYREVIDWLQTGDALEATIEQVAAHTRQLARRQETWFRSFSEVRQLSADASKSTHDLVETLLGEIHST